MLIEEPIGAGALGLLMTWVRGSTETIAKVIAKAITSGMTQIGLGLFPHPSSVLVATIPKRLVQVNQ